MSTFLVVAHQTAATPELRDALLAKRREDRRAIFVLLTPATPVEKLLYAAREDSVTLAEQSIKAAREFLEKAGLEIAQAIVGDSDPLTAIQAEFRRARRTYDGIILCTLPFGTSRWLESGLPGQVEAMFRVPLLHVVASRQSVAQQSRGRVITFSVRLGSAGDEIARLVAGRLSLAYYDWEVTSTAAALAGVSPGVIATSERAQSLLERVLDRLASTGVYSDEESVGRLSSTTMASAIHALGSQQYREFVEEVVLELAARGGCVLVGHASQVVLRSAPGVFKTMITGSVEQRAQRIALDEGRTVAEAEKTVRESDKERKAFFKQTYNVDLLDASLYDLVLSSDRISPEAASAIVADAYEQSSWEQRESEI